jgi:hypothetical protein
MGTASQQAERDVLAENVRLLSLNGGSSSLESYQIQSEELSDLKVLVYGNTAVAAATNRMKGTYKGEDLRGDYRFTDTWVKRNGKGHVVASRYTTVLEAWPTK